MKTKQLLVISLVFVVVLLGSCTKKASNSTEVLESTTVAVTSEETTTTVVATSETTTYETTTETITAPIVYEDVYESESFPDLNVVKNSASSFTLTIECNSLAISENIEVNQDRCYYDFFRVDKKVISSWFWGNTSIEGSNDADHTKLSYVYSTSGELLELTDVVYDPDLFIEYLGNRGRYVEESHLNEIDWVFDVLGLIIMSDNDRGLRNCIFIPYDEFDGMININYIPDEGSPMYGDAVHSSSSYSFLEHRFSFNQSSNYAVDGEGLPAFETEDGQCMYNPTLLYFISANGRYYIWAYQTEIDYNGAENTSTVVINVGMLIEITTGIPEVVATTTEGPPYYYQIHDIPSDILELIGYPEW